MGVSISGLVSNMDTDAIVAALVSGYTVKKQSYEKEKTKLEWKQEAWKDLNTKVKNFYSNQLSNMRFSTAFNKKTSVVSGSQATVVASNDAVIGTQRLKVKQLATSGYLTGGVIADKDGGKVSGSTKMSELGIADGSKLTVSVDGKERTITLDADTTVDRVVTELKEAGMNANFDAKNQRFFVSSKTSGVEGDFQLMAANDGGTAALQKLGLAVTTSKDGKSYLEVAQWDLDTVTKNAWDKKRTATYDITDEATVKRLVDGLRASNEVDKKTIAELKKIETDKLTDEQKKQLENLETDVSKRELIVSSVYDEKNGTYATITKDGDGKYYIDGNDASANEFVLYAEETNAKITDSNAQLYEDLEKEFSNKISEAKKYAVVYSYDLVNNTPNVDTNSEDYKKAAAYLATLQDAASEYNAAKATIGVSADVASGPTRIEGQDAIIELNGAIFTSNTNTFQVNGLTITANAETAKKDMDGNIISDEEVTVTTDTDAQGIYDMIKGFLKEYNSLIIEMDKLYGADSAKGYEPLTDDEREAMSEDEIEKWEKKIKDSLLRRDSTLDSVINSMKNAMQTSVQLDGKTYNLSSFGVKTLSYFSAPENEKGAYHIDGDKDDANTSGNSDRLMAMIGTDPETVAGYFNKLAANMYNSLTKKMQSSTLSSAFTLYNDKQMKTEQNEYKKLISQWEDKIETYEDRYRKQFAAMESALASLNAQQSQLGGLFSA